MAIDFTTYAPYYDDYDEDKGFHRLLFNPGRAVQARELTQLQTILQNQIRRFGQNIFLEGTVVIPGGVTIDTNYQFVKVTQSDISGIEVGATITGVTSGLTAELIQKVEVDGGDPATLYIRYTGGSNGNGGKFANNEQLNYTNPGGGGAFFNSAASNAAGAGTKVNLDKGVYFVKGFFVVATSQSLIVEKYGIPTGTFEVGLVSSEEIVTSAADSSLFSNAQGTNNFNAPGADRYKLALTLAKKADVNTANDDYFTIATIKDGLVVEALTRSKYALLGDELARRTYDESGNYTVDPFIVRSELSTLSTDLDFIADPGRAYVKGYEVSKTISTTITQPRALDTETKTLAQTPVNFGNYVRTNAPTGLPDISTLEQVDLLNASALVIGTAYVRAAEKESGGKYRFYLFGVNMTTGGFNTVKSLAGASFSATLIDATDTAVDGTNATLLDTANNTLVFSLPRERVQSTSDFSIRAQRRVTFTASGGSATLNTGSSNIIWSDTAEWIIVNSAGAIATATFTAAGSQTITLSALADANGAHTAIAYINKSAAAATPRTKTLQTVTDEVITPEGDNSVILKDTAVNITDAVELISVKDVANGDADITSRYTLDGGQRDNYYDLGRLYLKSNATAPTGNVKVTFKYFDHGGSGDFFSVDSYSALAYSDIPTYTTAGGSSIFLADALDFRPVIDSTGADFSLSGSIVHEIPQNNETIQSNITYYLPRIDILYVSPEGDFEFATGVASLNPVVPPVPNGVMPIYEVIFNPGTLDENDVSMAFIDNKRYTMRDIGRIEERVARVEEWSTLSLLESETDALEVIDANGLNRFKSGFFVDNFEDHLFADFENAQYRASIDPRIGELRPTFTETNNRFFYRASASDGSTSSNVVIKGDFLFMSYTEGVEISQPLASSSINVNPYAVITGTGMITLSPESDEWRDVETQTRTVAQTNEEQRISPNQTENFNNWQWNWGGFPNVNITRQFGQGGGAARITDGAIFRRR